MHFSLLAFLKQYINVCPLNTECHQVIGGFIFDLLCFLASVSEFYGIFCIIEPLLLFLMPAHFLALARLTPATHIFRSACG